MTKYRLSITISGDFDPSCLLDALGEAIPDIVGHIEASAYSLPDEALRSVWDEISQSACVEEVDP
jgi:hypothetical protein